LRYLANLSPGKIVLWCFLLWYLATVIHHFDATPAIWWNAPASAPSSASRSIYRFWSPENRRRIAGR
jgi:hypothetical protein